MAFMQDGETAAMLASKAGQKDTLAILERAGGPINKARNDKSCFFSMWIILRAA